MTEQLFPTEEEKGEFVRLQLEVDALLDLPDETDPAGPTGPADRYFALGRTWVRYFFTGCYLSVREYMRPTVLPYADLTLNISDCVDGMTHVLAELTALDEVELAKAADGAFRARRHARQKATGMTDANVRPRSATSRRGPSQQPETPPNSHDPRAGLPGTGLDRQFPIRLQAASEAIRALRPPKDSFEPPAGDVGDASKLRLLAQAWAVFYVTGLAHQIGGPQGVVMASIADPNLSPDECVAGLVRVRDRLARLTPAEREAVHRHIDTAFHRYVPEFDFELV